MKRSSPYRDGRQVTRGGAPQRGQPTLHHFADEALELLTELALQRVGAPESVHSLNGTEVVAVAHSVTGCGRCGGVYGGDGIAAHGRCPTRRCTCKRK